MGTMVKGMGLKAYAKAHLPLAMGHGGDYGNMSGGMESLISRYTEASYFFIPLCTVFP